MKKKITFGADPEFHLMDLLTHKVTSALSVLKTTKAAPIDLGDGIKLYADNALAEAAFPPAVGPEAITEQIRDVFIRIIERIGKTHDLLHQAYITYPKEELADKSLWEAGCNPNYDAWNENRQNAAAKFRDGGRTGSFHLHIGHDGLDTMDKKVQMVKLMDIVVGCASVIFDRDPTAMKRRELYGRAGENRSTDYGIEYRVLGNSPLHSPITTRLVWDLTQYAVDRFDAGEAEAMIEAVGSGRVTLAINTCDKTKAREVLDIIALPNKLMLRCEQDNDLATFREEWGL